VRVGQVGVDLWECDFAVCVGQFVWVGVSDFVLYVGEFGLGSGQCVCAVCGRVLCGFVGVRICFVWDTLECV